MTYGSTVLLLKNGCIWEGQRLFHRRNTSMAIMELKENYVIIPIGRRRNNVHRARASWLVHAATIPPEAAHDHRAAWPKKSNRTDRRQETPLRAAQLLLREGRMSLLILRASHRHRKAPASRPCAEVSSSSVCSATGRCKRCSASRCPAAGSTCPLLSASRPSRAGTRPSA